MNTLERLSALDNYKARKEREKLEAQQAEIDKYNNFYKTISLLSDRVSNLIDVANKALEVGIDIERFLADGFYHRVGFIRPYPWDNRKWYANEMGILAGGYCGSDDLHITREGNCYSINSETKSKNSFPKYGVESFIASFDKFETNFYDFIDKIVKNH